MVTPFSCLVVVHPEKAMQLKMVMIKASERRMDFIYIIAGNYSKAVWTVFACLSYKEV
jgi:hypothetical protein